MSIASKAKLFRDAGSLYGRKGTSHPRCPFAPFARHERRRLIVLLPCSVTFGKDSRSLPLPFREISRRRARCKRIPRRGKRTRSLLFSRESRPGKIPRPRWQGQKRCHASYTVRIFRNRRRFRSFFRSFASENRPVPTLRDGTPCPSRWGILAASASHTLCILPLTYSWQTLLFP